MRVIIVARNDMRDLARLKATLQLAEDIHGVDLQVVLHTASVGEVAAQFILAERYPHEAFYDDGRKAERMLTQADALIAIRDWPDVEIDGLIAGAQAAGMSVILG